MAERTSIVKIVPTAKKPRKDDQPAHHVAVLAYSGLCTFEFGIAVELFGLPRPELKSWYSFEVCGLEPGPLKAIGGVTVSPHGGLTRLLKADTIIIPGWRNPEEIPPARLLRTLRKAHDQGARLVSICSGVFVLAATGLLNARRATTHWRYLEKLHLMYPEIALEPNVLYVDEGDLLTSAGSAAGIDLCLHLIRKDYGAVVTNTVARRLVVSPHREGGQAQFIDKPVGSEAEPWFAKLLDWVQRNLDRPLQVDELAAKAHMSKRTFARRFAAATGTSPLEWITGLRVNYAKELLETTALSVEEVAEKSGFGSAPVLRHHFRKRLELSPNVYRYRFRLQEDTRPQ